MPKYDFKCLSCSHEFTLNLPPDSSKSQDCLECGKEAKKLFSPPNIHFSGSGFYKNDSKDKSSDKK